MMRCMRRISCSTIDLHTRLAVLVTLSGWVLLFWSYTPTHWYTGLLPAVVVSVTGLLLVATVGGNKLTALLGKVVIFIAAIQLFIAFIESLTIAVNSSEWWLIYAIITGLVLERVSPHQQFYPWMFLGIATKVQFGLVSGAVVHFEYSAGLLPEAVWWSSVAVLAVSVPLAATKQRTLYRMLVALSSLVSVLLLTDLAARFGTLTVTAMVLALAAILWLPLVDRWVGRKIFLPSTSGVGRQ